MSPQQGAVFLQYREDEEGEERMTNIAYNEELLNI